MTDSRQPGHVAFIMDGNRRFAKRLMMEPTKGHEWGAKKVRQVCDWCKKAQVREVTFYTFSTENFNRPKVEFDYLMGIFNKELSVLLHDPTIMEQGIRIRFLGRLWMFGPELEKLMKDIVEKTKDNDRFFLNFAIAYGGRSEIVDAAKRIVDDVARGNLDPSKIDEGIFKDYLYSSSEPDMIIRTGGDRRTSNFLIYQSAYSEWFFLEKFWPDIEESDVVDCISVFMDRERRFGR